MKRVAKAVRLQVRRRAGDRCEYCRILNILEVDHTLDHILPRQHGGSNALMNLAWACARCNRHKGTNFASVDLQKRKVAFLFNPRLHDWADHFEFINGRIVGTSTIGRVTVTILSMNSPDRIELRRQLVNEGTW